MARLFPFRSETAAEEGQPRVVDLEGEDADAVFAALSSTTARRIYAHLDDQPATPSDIADAIDTSIQNVRYHLENLEDAGLIEVVDTWYSSRGNEMSVYATTDGPLIVASDESRATQLKDALSRFIGGVGALAGGSLLVQYVLTRWLAPTPTGTTDGGAGSPKSDGAAGGASSGGFGIESVNDTGGTETAANGSAGADGSGLDAGNEAARNATDGSVEAADAVFGAIPPGLLFFLGGLVVLLVVTVYWYRTRPAY
ncbi:ArsR/SmtB family transcription factor [Natrinema sp. 74]|uniref:ArsR/SmtB family transcription factor n=1 Tax=Natrinema sp. 74 TaxID=3384159 RepID=UPI0038D477FB